MSWPEMRSPSMESAAIVLFDVAAAAVALVYSNF
jgi:hypothetical protein